MIQLVSSPKSYAVDQDKSLDPADTLRTVKDRLTSLSLSILAETRRIDTGRLGIPVFLSVCGPDARAIMPTRKQMGKGATPAQAEASALMELMERYGFFTFWERLPDAEYLTWTQAEQRFDSSCMPIEEVIAACHDSITPEQGRRLMDCRRWIFVPALRIHDQREIRVPLDLFKQLGEFNGSSAGNTDVESILQGVCELVERHVCCLADREHMTLPTIDLSPASLQNPTLIELVERFHNTGITLLLKDMSMGMPVPTVAALAYDPATFPEASEIVFTAGTASSPAKAAIRALTEVAQLAGDFATHACYEASGLPKYERLDQIAWLQEGPRVSLQELPSVENADQLTELLALDQGLHEQGYTLYSVSTTHPQTKVPTHYNFAPGLCFRERDANASLGLFVGRMLSEEAEEADANHSFALLEDIYPQAHFLPFFRGMIALRAGRTDEAAAFFAQATPLQPDAESQALAAFYHAYTLTLTGEHAAALPFLRQSVELCPDMKEYRNLYGVCLFKAQRFAEAAEEFSAIVTRLDKGSAMDWMNLGMCRKHEGDIPEAQRCLLAAVSIDPSLDRARDVLRELNGGSNA